jgi:hypothetical protein
MQQHSAADDCVYRFVWVEEDDPAQGGQWMAYPPDGYPWPVALADAVLAAREEGSGEDPVAVHVHAAQRLVEATGALEDRLFPDSTRRLQAALAAVDADAPEIDPESDEGDAVRRAAEALEKVAADLAELVQEQLEGGSLATLPPDCTTALCQSVQAGWRMRRLVDPPSPLYL